MITGSFYCRYFLKYYSYPNVLSKLSLREQRIASFDNDLFDFYLSLDPKLDSMLIVCSI